MADISKITLPSGAEYDIKDAWARTQIETISGLDTVTFKGVSSTALTDGGNENPTVGGQVVTTKETGDLYFYGTEEFVYGDDNKWHALGSLESLGPFAYASTGSTTYTPAGTVSQPTFTGNAENVTFTIADNASGNYQPAGSISGGVFEGASSTFTGTYTPAGGVTTTTATTSNEKAAVAPAASGEATYTPAGSVAAPTISVATAGATDTVHNPAAVTVAKTVEAAAPGTTAPANAITYYSVTNENLSLYQIGYTTGDSITTSDLTVKTGDAAYEATAPAFTGTGVRLETGDIAVPATFTSAFTGTEATISTSGTPNGANTAATFTGTKVQIGGSVTATGTVSQPTFAGTEATIQVQPD